MFPEPKAPEFQLYPGIPIRQGLLLERKNRFVVRALLDEGPVDVHLPNPGRLWEILYSNTLLYLIPSGGKLPWRIIGAETPRGPVMLDTVRSNAAAEYLLRHRLITGLEDWEVVRRESTRGASRFDFLLRRGEEHMYLEVKSCTLFWKSSAMFPDAPTQRGTKHVRELLELSREPNLQGGVLILVQNPEVRSFLPDYHTDPEFAEALQEARHHLWIGARGLGWARDFTLRPPGPALEIPWEILRRENRNAGCWGLILHVPAPFILPAEAGLLRPLAIPRGYYLALGREGERLSSRLARRERKRARPEDPLDLFLFRTKRVKSFLLRSPGNREHILRQKCAALAEWSLEELGLFGFSSLPLDNPGVVGLLLEERMLPMEAEKNFSME